MAFYLKEILKFDKKVYTVGTTGMVEEFDALKIPHTGSGVSQFFVNFNKKKPEVRFFAEPYTSRILSFLLDRQDQGLFSRVSNCTCKKINSFLFFFIFILLV